MFRTLAAFCFLFLASFLYAQDFEVSPVLMSFNADPGEIQTKQINLINHSSIPQKYVLKVSDYVTDKDGNKKSVPAGKSKRSCADWVTINPSIIELNPNQSAIIEALMTVPKDGFSAKWCMICVEVTKEQTAFEADKSLATGVVLVPRITILVKQSPRNNTNYKATISGLREITKAGDPQRTFEVQVANTGDNIIDANVNLALADMQTAKEDKFSPVKVTVYPDAVRTVKLQLPAKLNKGKYALAAILDYGHRQPMEGTQMLLEVK
ncbi:MAG: hypothetical protein Q8904_09830 [Bacteroidota bacterium]|nr:hypothetical protein [Bacteroidota bacterium]